ncbi:MAG: hypothetical protein IPI87_02000 [Betaproteobacteria bacterium]|nr:hypothetical protein [Betaproteobacteria bacterium]
MPFDAFLEAAWNDHGDRPREVADRLAASLDTITAPEHVAQYARIVTHVFGEHLGEWARGVALLRSLREHPAFDRSSAAEGAIARGIGALLYAGGDARALEALSQDDRIAAIATASSAFAGLGEFKRALDAYAQALALADAGLPEGSPALRAFAIGGNNLAAALRRSATATTPRRRAWSPAAQSGLDYWKRAGTWFEEERALATGEMPARRRAPARGSRERRALSRCATATRQRPRSSASPATPPPRVRAPRRPATRGVRGGAAQRVRLLSRSPTANAHGANRT